MWYWNVRSMTDRIELMHVILTAMGREMNEVIERTGREWNMLLVGLCRETSTRMTDVVKEFLEKMWYARSRNYSIYLEYALFSVCFPFFFFFPSQELLIQRPDLRETSCHPWHQDQG